MFHTVQSGWVRKDRLEVWVPAAEQVSLLGKNEALLLEACRAPFSLQLRSACGLYPNFYKNTGCSITEKQLKKSGALPFGKVSEHSHWKHWVGEFTHASVNRIKAWPGTYSVTGTHASLLLVSGLLGFTLCCAWSVGLPRQNKRALGAPGRMKRGKVSCMCRVPDARPAPALPEDPVSSPFYCSGSWRLDHVPWGCLTPRKHSIPSSVFTGRHSSLTPKCRRTVLRSVHAQDSV